MKLATLRTAARDGELVVVSRDLSRAVRVGERIGGQTATLQRAVENWAVVRGALQALYDALNDGEAPDAFAFDPVQATSPLPRAYQWLDGSAFLSHGRLMQRALGLATNPQVDAPLMYQGASDDFLGPREAAPFPSEDDGIDFEGEFAVVVDETAMGVDASTAQAGVLLVLQVNDWSLRALAPREMKTGFGFLQAKPASAFAPVAVTPDELGPAWRDGRVHLPLEVTWNGEVFGRPEGGAMAYSFGELIAHGARTRRLRAGTIVGSGTVSNDDADEVGSACISERRALDMIAGRPPTAFMRFGDTVRMEALDGDGGPLFGAIEQTVTRASSD